MDIDRIEWIHTCEEADKSCGAGLYPGMILGFLSFGSISGARHTMSLAYKGLHPVSYQNIKIILIM